MATCSDCGPASQSRWQCRAMMVMTSIPHHLPLRRGGKHPWMSRFAAISDPTLDPRLPRMKITAKRSTPSDIEFRVNYGLACGLCCVPVLSLLFEAYATICDTCTHYHGSQSFIHACSVTPQCTPESPEFPRVGRNGRRISAGVGERTKTRYCSCLCSPLMNNGSIPSLF